jgi:hypothetical protein
VRAPTWGTGRLKSKIPREWVQRQPVPLPVLESGEGPDVFVVCFSCYSQPRQLQLHLSSVSHRQTRALKVRYNFTELWHVT